MNEGLIRIVVLALAAICCLSVGGIVIVAASGHDPPQALATIGSTVAGALVAILVVPANRPPSPMIHP